MLLILILGVLLAGFWGFLGGLILIFYISYKE